MNYAKDVAGENEAIRVVESAKPAMYALLPRLAEIQKSLYHATCLVLVEPGEPQMQKARRVHAEISTAVKALRAALAESERPA